MMTRNRHLRCPRPARLPPALHGPHRRRRRRSRHLRLCLGDLCPGPPPRPLTSATSSPANSSWSQRTASPAATSPRASSPPPPASLSTSTSPGQTPRSSAAGFRPVVNRWAVNLARESAVPADLIVPVPDSGVTAALGYAAESGIPFNFGPHPQSLCRPHLHRTHPARPRLWRPHEAQPQPGPA